MLARLDEGQSYISTELAQVQHVCTQLIIMPPIGSNPGRLTLQAQCTASPCFPSADTRLLHPCRQKLRQKVLPPAPRALQAATAGPSQQRALFQHRGTGAQGGCREGARSM